MQILSISVTILYNQSQFTVDLAFIHIFILVLFNDIFKKGVESDSSDDSVLWRWNKSKGEKMIILLVVFLRGALSSLWVRGSIQSDEERNKLRISTSLASSCWK